MSLSLNEVKNELILFFICYWVAVRQILFVFPDILRFFSSNYFASLSDFLWSLFIEFCPTASLWPHEACACVQSLFYVPSHPVHHDWVKFIPVAPKRVELGPSPCYAVTICCAKWKVVKGNEIRWNLEYSISLKKCTWFSCALFCCGYIIHLVWVILFIYMMAFRVTSLALGQSYDCPSASEVTLKNMGKHNVNHATTQHKLFACFMGHTV